MSKLPPTSSFDEIPSRGLFCYKCQRSNFSNDSKGRRSHAQHQRNCTGLSKHGVKVSGLHVSGTDPLPLLTKKRRIDELDFNFAYQLDNYLEDNDNFFDVNVDSDHPHDIHDLPSTTPDPCPCPIIHIGAPYNQNAVLPPSYRFQIELQTILDKHRISLKVHDELVGLIKSHSNTCDNKLPFSTNLLLNRNQFMTKLENIMDVSKLKHKDVEVKLSSGGVASVAVYDLETMIMSLLTDERLMNPENIASGYDLFTGKSEGDVHYLGEIHTGSAWEPAGMVHANVGHNVTYLTFFLRFFVPKPTYDMFANGHKTQQNTTKRKKHATMVVSRSQLQRHELLLFFRSDAWATLRRGRPMQPVEEIRS